MTLSAPPADATSRLDRPARLGVVSFLNTLPLIDGLESLADLTLQHSVPSQLIDQLLSGDVDVALCSSIDYLRAPEQLTILPSGLLGCDGPTMTVRLFATRPVETLERIFCDTDSHTSIALLRILLREQHDRDPEFVAYHAREHVAENRVVERPEAMLLIGDKVVTDAPSSTDYPVQIDLGAAWKAHTGLPFVFALWLARPSTPSETVAMIDAVLDRQRRYNCDRVDVIVHDRAEPRNWPRDVARTYLADRLRYALDDAHRAGLELFFEKAAAHALVDTPRPVRFWPDTA